MNEFIFCFYDLNYNPEFLKSWVSLVNFLFTKKIKFLISPGNSCNAFYAKQMCLGGSVLRGSKQSPFNGQVQYKYLVFLSGQISFTVKDFIKLYNKCNLLNASFISANVKNRNEIGREFIDNIALANYVEFDMVFIKRGIFEKLTYPWFKPHESKNTKQMDFVDIDICNRIRQELKVDLHIYNEVNLKRGNIVYE